jgi:hypothetical protein
MESDAGGLALGLDVVGLPGGTCSRQVVDESLEPNGGLTLEQPPNDPAALGVRERIEQPIRRQGGGRAVGRRSVLDLVHVQHGTAIHCVRGEASGSIKSLAQYFWCYRIRLPNALAASSVASDAVSFRSSNTGFTSTSSSERSVPRSATISMAAWASR